MQNRLLLFAVVDGSELFSVCSHFKMPNIKEAMSVVQLSSSDKRKKVISVISVRILLLKL